MKYRTLLFLTVILFIALHSAVGQKKLVHTMTSQRYSIREGMAQVQTYRVFQDSYGYIWTVMGNGVSRFDGKNLRTYPTAELGLKSRVLYINQYKESVFFVARDGISFLHADGSIAFYAMTEGYKISNGGVVGESRIVMANGQLYMSMCLEDVDNPTSQNSFFIFNLENKTFKKNKEYDFEGQLHVVENKMIIFKNGKNSYLKVYKLSGDTLGILKEHTLEKEIDYCLIENNPGNEFFLSDITADVESSRIYSCRLLPDNTFTKELIGEIPHRALVVRRMDEKNIFVSNIYDAYLIEGNQQRLFPINTIVVNYATKDRDGNLWLATDEGLINCYHLLFDSYKLGIKHNDYIWSVAKDIYDNIWFASYNVGFWRADKNENITKAKVYHNGKERTVDLAYMDSAEDPLGRIFFASEYGLVVFDPRKGNSTNLTLYETGCALAVYYDTITSCIYSGGVTVIGDVGTTTLVRMNEQLEVKSYPLNNRHIICIHRDSKRKLRIGTYAGEYIFDEVNEVFIEDTVARPYRGLIAMELDKKGYLWKGTTTGVYAEDTKGNLIKIQGTSQNASYLMCYDDRYVIWGFADKLAILDLQAFHKDTTDIQIRMFDSFSGYDALEAGQNGDYIDKDGYVWVIGADKVLRFHPDELMSKPEPVTPPPYIAAVFNKDKDADWQLAQYDDEITLENSSNNLRFDLLQASIMAPDKLTFRYRLKGYNDHWENTNEPVIVFQNLPFGKYQIEVQSSIDSENWSKSSLSQLITIKRPFWLTFPCISTLSIGIIFLLLSITYWVRKISLKKQEEKQQIERLKYRAVQSKFIPHFTGNVLNSINHLISKDPKLAQKYIVDFSDFSRQTLLYSEKLNRTLKEELDYIKIYLKLEKLRFEEDLEYSITTDPAIDLKMKVPMMVLQTFCENAIKHGLHHKGAPGSLKVEVLIQNDYAVLAVEDDGIGRAKAHELKTEGSKEGLNIVNEQLKFFNKTNKRKSYLKVIDLYDNYRNPTGTRFELYIPVFVVLGIANRQNADVDKPEYTLPE